MIKGPLSVVWNGGGRRRQIPVYRRPAQPSSSNWCWWHWHCCVWSKSDLERLPPRIFGQVEDYVAHARKKTIAGSEREEGKPATSARTVWLELPVCAPEVLVVIVIVVANFGSRLGAVDVGDVRYGSGASAWSCPWSSSGCRHGAVRETEGCHTRIRLLPSS